jgi:hypothetical protein
MPPFPCPNLSCGKRFVAVLALIIESSQKRFIFKSKRKNKYGQKIGEYN